MSINKIVGDTVKMTGHGHGGTPPYTIQFYKDTNPLATFLSVPDGADRSYTYTLVAPGDIGTRVFKMVVTDSCATPQTCSKESSVTVKQCAAPTGDLTVT